VKLITNLRLVRMFRRNTSVAPVQSWQLYFCFIAR